MTRVSHPRLVEEETRVEHARCHAGRGVKHESAPLQHRPAAPRPADVPLERRPRARRRRAVEPVAAGPAARGASGAVPSARSIRPDAPLLPRGPHFAPKAKRVLVIFCSGAVSHVDTFDYKPELLKRDGQPMPGADKLVTFQGAQGNLVRPLWQFRPRGQSREDDLRPAPPPRRAGGRPVLRPLDDGQVQHPRPRREPDGHGVHARRFSRDGRVGDLRTGQRIAEPPRLRRHPRPPRRPPDGPEPVDQRIPARGVPGHRVQRATSRSRTSPAPQASRPAPTPPRATSSACSTTSTCSATPATPTSPRASRATSWPGGCSSVPRR